ncbi:MAG TPA: lysine exporter LysO family protein [Defluviitaleaceae bacterium]|nr:lysine exporter LysO family protein [Defluviitaleaceae bacterium]
MKGNIAIVVFFVIGSLLGYSNIVPVDFLNNQISYYVLCMLMLCVGFSVGNDAKILRSFKNFDSRLFLLPLATILGTLIGCGFVSIFLPHRTIMDCMAVGSGFGYYSLSSIFITEYKGVQLGTIALLSNILREILTLLLTPLLVKYFGKLAPISAGGATTMDTTLPIIMQYSGKEYVPISVFHGFVTDFSVPFLVTLFCSL